MAAAHRLAQVDVADGHIVAAGRMMGVEELRVPGNAVVELGTAGHIGVREDVLADDAARIAHAVQAGDGGDR